MIPPWESSSYKDASGTLPGQSESHDLAGTEKKKALLAIRDQHERYSASNSTDVGLGE